MVTRRQVQLGVVLTAVLLAAAGCATAPPQQSPTAAPAPALAEPVVDAPPVEIDTARVLAEEREVLADERLRTIELEQELLALRARLTRVEERYAALEQEHESTLEELLRSKASVRSVQSRALATSRIAEIRVAIQSVEQATPTDDGPLERAGDFLERADAELAEGNYNGAVYLADRAGDLVREATVATPVASLPDTEPVLALMPPHRLRTTANANVREGPALSFERIATLPAGHGVTARAASGTWRHVEDAAGARGWVHSSLLVAREPFETVELVTTKRVNLRQGPGLDYEPLAVLASGEMLRALGRQGGWYRVERSNGDSGWAHGDYLQPAGGG